MMGIFGTNLACSKGQGGLVQVKHFVQILILRIIIIPPGHINYDPM